MTTSKDQERVLCVLANNVPEEILECGGFYPIDSPRATAKVLELFHLPFHWVDRIDCEHRPSLKQIIPYTSMLSVTASSRFKILSYTRSKAGGENRLHSKFSIGIGGHINPEDMTDHSHDSHFLDIYKNAATREINEEINLQDEIDFDLRQLHGIIYDSSNEVGQVHLGISYCHYLKEELIETVTAKSEDIKDLQFEYTSDLQSRIKDAETWTRLVFNNLVQDVIPSFPY